MIFVREPFLIYIEFASLPRYVFFVMVSAIGTLHLAAFIDDLLLILLLFFQNDKSYWYLL